MFFAVWGAVHKTSDDSLDCNPRPRISCVLRFFQGSRWMTPETTPRSEQDIKDFVRRCFWRRARERLSIRGSVKQSHTFTHARVTPSAYLEITKQDLISRVPDVAVPGRGVCPRVRELPWKFGRWTLKETLGDADGIPLVAPATAPACLRTQVQAQTFGLLIILPWSETTPKIRQPQLRPAAKPSSSQADPCLQCQFDGSGAFAKACLLQGTTRHPQGSPTGLHLVESRQTSRPQQSSRCQVSGAQYLSHKAGSRRSMKETPDLSRECIRTRKHYGIKGFGCSPGGVTQLSAGFGRGSAWPKSQVLPPLSSPCQLFTGSQNMSFLTLFLS